LAALKNKAHLQQIFRGHGSSVQEFGGLARTEPCSVGQQLRCGATTNSSVSSSHGRGQRPVLC